MIETVCFRVKHIFKRTHVMRGVCMCLTSPWLIYHFKLSLYRPPVKRSCCPKDKRESEGNLRKISKKEVNTTHRKLSSNGQPWKCIWDLKIYLKIFQSWNIFMATHLFVFITLGSTTTIQLSSVALSRLQCSY